MSKTTIVKLAGTSYSCTYSDEDNNIKIEALMVGGKLLPLSLCVPNVLKLLKEKIIEAEKAKLKTDAKDSNIAA